ncbi:MAG: IgGFc-binding protein, partial [Pseudomonadota bacterium]
MINKMVAATAVAYLLGSTSMAHATTLIANFHENLLSGNNSLFLFGEEGTTGSISSIGGFSTDFTIDMTGVFELSLGLDGQAQTENGVVNGQSLTVDASAPISGFALNRAPETSDGTVLLDAEGLGQEYLVLSTPGIAGEGSQFSITAVEDNTTVTVTSTVDLPGNPAGTSFDVVLNQGESVFFESGLGGDVSGTSIVSNNDIAVFAGAECTNVPSGVFACDHLIAQQFSVDNFDTEFNIVANFGGGSDGDLIRVIASVDGTEVFLDGALVGTIDAGEFLEIDNVGNAVLTSSEPVSVGQFIRGQGGTRTTGDPAFGIIPSVDQEISSYAFAAPVGEDAFEENFLNVAIDAAFADTLTLNGELVDISLFELIGDTLF